MTVYGNEIFALGQCEMLDNLGTENRGHDCYFPGSSFKCGWYLAHAGSKDIGSVSTCWTYLEREHRHQLPIFIMGTSCPYHYLGPWGQISKSGYLTFILMVGFK